MADWQLNTPVSLLIFNRPETTARLFEQIRRARPPRLLIVADGPRAGQAGEGERCRVARSVVERVDWPCEVLTNYSEVNMCCKRRVSSGLDWVFDAVPEAIVLEDDCLPHPSFFRFCEELLGRHRDDKHVMHISGDNFQFGRRRQRASYYFSRYPHVWGWASWRRAWRHYDAEMTEWTTARDKSAYLDQFTDPSERAFWEETWDRVAAGKIDTWDYQWAFACMARRGLSIMPSTNLISNMGFGEGALHTTSESELANLPVAEVGFPLRHPGSLATDAEADAHTARLFFGRGAEAG